MLCSEIQVAQIQTVKFRSQKKFKRQKFKYNKIQTVEIQIAKFWSKKIEPKKFRMQHSGYFRPRPLSSDPSQAVVVIWLICMYDCLQLHLDERCLRRYRSAFGPFTEKWDGSIAFTLDCLTHPWYPGCCNLFFGLKFFWSEFHHPNFSSLNFRILNFLIRFFTLQQNSYFNFK